MFVRAYLRASTAEQDATRARDTLTAFAAEHGQRIAAYYVENESGARLDRPELLRLIDDAQEGDVILVEQVDRLARLKNADWETLKSMLAAKRLLIVSPELPTTWAALQGNDGAADDDITAVLMRSISAMLLDILASMARKDYDDRRRRQAQGIAKARAAGAYTGRARNERSRAAVARLLESGATYNEVIEVVGCSRWLVADVAKELKAAAGV